MTNTRQERLRALGQMHADWVRANLPTVSGAFDSSGYPEHSDYNLHHIDLDADGAAQDTFEAAAHAILAGPSSASVHDGKPRNHKPGGVDHDQSRHSGGFKGFEVIEVESEQHEVLGIHAYSYGDISVDWGGGNLTMSAQAARELPGFLDELAFEDVPDEPNLDDPERVVEWTSSDATLSAVLWDTGVVEVGEPGSIVVDSSDNLLLEPEDFGRFADALEQVTGFAPQALLEPLLFARAVCSRRRLDAHKPGGREHNQQDHAGGVIGHDVLGLAKRVTLEDGETFIASESGKTASGAHETGMAMALLGTPAGPRLRLAEVANRDATRWDPGDEYTSYASTELSAAQAREMRDGLADLETLWKREQANAREAGRAFEAIDGGNRVEFHGETWADWHHDEPFTPEERRVVERFFRYTNPDEPLATGRLTDGVGWALRGNEPDIDYGSETLKAEIFIGERDLGSPTFLSAGALRRYRARLENMLDLAEQFADSHDVENHATTRTVALLDQFIVAGDDRALRRYWTRGEGALKIRWGTEGDFDRCVKAVRQYSDGGTEFDPEGYCAELHREATGQWPGQGRGHNTTDVVVGHLPDRHDQRTHSRKHKPAQADPTIPDAPARTRREDSPEAPEVAEARRKLERAEIMHGPDRSKWSKRDQRAAERLERIIERGSRNLASAQVEGRSAYGEAEERHVEAAGLAVMAGDTSRVLMLQRALDEDDPAAGTWEFPGGGLEPGEDPLDAAMREWSEETGCELPDGELVGKWDHGVYCGYVWPIDNEADVSLHGGRDDVSNPDDPDADAIEALAWWDPGQLTSGNPALRDELRQSMTAVLTALGNADSPAVIGLQAKCDPDQPRDNEGKWTDGVAGGGVDKLKLSGRIQLGPGEKLLSSRKIRTTNDRDSWDLLAAEVDTPNGRQVRLGVVAEPKLWAAGPDPRRAERISDLDRRIAELEDGPELAGDDLDRLDALRDERAELGNDDDAAYDRTAVLAPASVDRLRSEVERGAEQARQRQKEWKKFWADHEAESDEFDALHELSRRRSLTAEQQTRMDELSRIFDAGPEPEVTFASGIVPGGPEGDLAYEVASDDSGDWDVRLGIKPPNAKPGWYIGSIIDDQAVIGPGQVKAFLKDLEELSGATPSVTNRSGTARRLRGKFDPSQPRDDEGRWADGVPGGSDKLKLAGRVLLGPGQTLRSSRRIRSGSWDVLAAEIDTPNGREVRLGVINPADRRKWTAGPDPKRAARARQLSQQLDELDEDTDDYEQMRAELDDLTGESDAINRTTSLTPDQIGQLRTNIEAGIAKARAMLARDQRPDSGEFASGVIPGGLDGDLEWRLDDALTGEDEDWVLNLAVRPHGEGDDWLPEGDDWAHFDPSQTKSLLRALSELSANAVAQPANTHNPHIRAHTPGGHQHNQQDHAGGSKWDGLKGLDVMSADEYTAEYGDVVDEYGIDLGDGDRLSARFFEDGTAHVAIDFRDGRSQVVGDINGSEGLRRLAYDIEDAINAVEDDDTDDEEWEQIVWDTESSDHDFRVGRYGSGDIRLEPLDAEDWFDFGDDQTGELVEALRSAADSYDDEFDTGVVIEMVENRSAAQVSGLSKHTEEGDIPMDSIDSARVLNHPGGPGHRQQDHGRKRRGMNLPDGPGERFAGEKWGDTGRPRRKPRGVPQEPDEPDERWAGEGRDGDGDEPEVTRRRRRIRPRRGEERPPERWAGERPEPEPEPERQKRRMPRVPRTTREPVAPEESAWRKRRETSASVADTPWFRISNNLADGGATVHIYNEIGALGLSADQFTRELSNLDVPSIELRLNSPGGDVFEGIAIHNALRQHPAQVHVHVDGVAASIASVIAMAGDKVTMARGSQMMIHEGHTVAVGNSADMAKTAALLDKCSNTIAQFYADRAGGTVEQWRDRMRAETWYSAEEAVQAGLADAVETPPRGVRAAWNLSVFNYAGRRFAPPPDLSIASPPPGDNTWTELMGPLLTASTTDAVLAALITEGK